MVKSDVQIMCSYMAKWKLIHRYRSGNKWWTRWVVDTLMKIGILASGSRSYDVQSSGIRTWVTWSKVLTLVLRITETRNVLLYLNPPLSTDLLRPWSRPKPVGPLRFYFKEACMCPTRGYAWPFDGDRSLECIHFRVILGYGVACWTSIRVYVLLSDLYHQLHLSKPGFGQWSQWKRLMCITPNRVATIGDIAGAIQPLSSSVR